MTWDITALSYYCMWHGSLSNLYNVIADVKSRYGKPVVIAETAYPFTTANADSETNSVTGSTLCDGIPASWAGQATEFTYVLEHRPQRRRDRRLLLGTHLVRDQGQRLGPGEHKRHRGRAGTTWQPSTGPATSTRH